jgi:hypothetical protein
MKFYIKIGLILLTVLLFASPTFAWEQSFEGHPDDLPSSLMSGQNVQSRDHGFADKAGYLNGTQTLKINLPYDGYLAYSLKFVAYQGWNQGHQALTLRGSDGTIYFYKDYYISNSPYDSFTYSNWNRVEFVENDLKTGITCYINGVLFSNDAYISSPTNPQNITLTISSGVNNADTWIDDISNKGTIVGCDNVVSIGSQYYTVGFTPLINNFAGAGYWFTETHSPNGRSLYQNLSVANLSEQSIPGSFFQEPGNYIIKVCQHSYYDNQNTSFSNRIFGYQLSLSSRVYTDKTDYSPGDTITAYYYLSPKSNYSGYTIQIPYYDSTGTLKTYIAPLTSTESSIQFKLPSTARGGSFVISLSDPYGGVKAGVQYYVLVSEGLTDLSIDKTVYSPSDVVKIKYSNMPQNTVLTIKTLKGNTPQNSYSWNYISGSGVLTYQLTSDGSDTFIVSAISGTTQLGQTTGTIKSGIYYLSGSIVDPSDGSLIPGASIIIGSASTVSDINGHFNLSVPAGWQSISITKTGYQSNINKVNIVYPVATQDFYLVKSYSGNGHSLYGLVTDYYTGAPVGSALITLKQGATTHTLFSYTGSGYYIYDAEDMAGNWTVTVTKTGYYTSIQTVTISGDTYKQIILTPTTYSSTGDTGSTDSSGGSDSDSSGSITNGGTSGSTDASTIDTTGVSQDRPGREAAKGAMNELEQTIPSLIGITVVMAFIKLISS